MGLGVVKFWAFLAAVVSRGGRGGLRGDAASLRVLGLIG